MAAVAKNGDVQAIASKIPVPGTTPAPGWMAGPVTYPGQYSKRRIGGTKVIYEAKCTFTYTGTTTSIPPAPYSTSSTITLTATKTILQKGNNYVLKVGDFKNDSFGNILKVKTVSNKLKTS